LTFFGRSEKKEGEGEGVYQTGPISHKQVETRKKSASIYEKHSPPSVP
jgi:hypothetical protein